jgi:glycerate 2-kinase
MTSRRSVDALPATIAQSPASSRTGAILRKQALSIFRSALKAANPAAGVAGYLKNLNVSRFERIYVIGAGKAAATMAQAAERVLGGRITAGFVNTKYGHAAKLRRVEQNECGHPEPDEQGMLGAGRIAAIARSAGERDLVICLISGGASALLPLPAWPVTLPETQALTRMLLASGAGIREMNTVRKHISDIKGGRLASLAFPARVETLLLSDVVGDPLDVIGSGPTAPDQSTFAEAAAILKSRGIWSKAPASITERIARGIRGELPETPKPRDTVFSRVHNVLIGSARLAVAAAARRARELGFRTLVLATGVEGEARDVARVHAAIARELVMSGQPVKPPACIISAGETTVTLRGPGLGGRNQEFALAAALDIAGLSGILMFSAGTDGTDGPTDAAGAFADGDTLRRKPDAGDYLDRNDSYHYFEALGDLVKTGPTGTNVMDIRLILAVEPRPRRARRPIG